MLSAEDSQTLPKRFRTTRGKIPQTYNTMGLATLNMSGSGQFSSSQFKALLNYLADLGISPSQLVVVDLREEPHAFLNGHAFGWYAKGAWHTHGDPVAVVMNNERERLAELSLGQTAILRKIVGKNKKGEPHLLTTKSYVITSLMTEEQLVIAAGAQYVRLPITDHRRPEDKVVDQFLELIKRLPSDAWLHWHCHGGRGRTSVAMVMYDMVRNPTLSRKAIIDRQVALGSIDIRERSNGFKSHKYPNEDARHAFINRFYDYLHAPDGYGVMSWTKWVAAHHYAPFKASAKRTEATLKRYEIRKENR